MEAGEPRRAAGGTARWRRRVCLFTPVGRCRWGFGEAWWEKGAGLVALEAPEARGGGNEDGSVRTCTIESLKHT